MPHMMGCRGAGHAGLKFTNVKLEPKYLLGKEGQGMEIAMHSLAVSRVHIADSNLGMAQRMLEMAIARSNDRITFGKPIASRQAIKMKIANMAAYIHALRCMVIDFAEDYDVDPHGPMNRREGGHVQARLDRHGTHGLRRDARRSSAATGISKTRHTGRPNACIAMLAPSSSRKALHHPTHHHRTQLPEVRRQGRVSAVIGQPPYIAASIAQEQTHS